MGRFLSESVSSLQNDRKLLWFLILMLFFHVFGHQCVIRVTF